MQFIWSVVATGNKGLVSIRQKMKSISAKKHVFYLPRYLEANQNKNKGTFEKPSYKAANLVNIIAEILYHQKKRDTKLIKQNKEMSLQIFIYKSFEIF